MGVPILTASTPQYQPLREGELVPDSLSGTITWTVATVQPPRRLVYVTARRFCRSAT